MALFLSEEPGLRASLNLYAKSRVDLDQDALEVAQLFANAAAGVLGMVRTVEQLTEALATRRTIGQQWESSWSATPSMTSRPSAP